MYINWWLIGQICPSYHPHLSQGHIKFVALEGTLILHSSDVISLCSDAAFKILNPKAVPKFFRLNSHNAILEFLLEVVFLFFFACFIKHTIHVIYFDSTLP